MPIGLKFGVCLDGANACPPEDCGGPGGYQMMLEALAGPTDDDHEHMVDWVGGSFDAAEFDVGLVTPACTQFADRAVARPLPDGGNHVVIDRIRHGEGSTLEF